MYKKCNICGAKLDPQEVCDCQDNITINAAFTSEFTRHDDYYDKPGLTMDGLKTSCKLKDKLLVRYDTKLQAAEKVIDLIARRLDVEPSPVYYFPDTAPGKYADSKPTSPLVRKIDEWIDRAGDKVKLKKRITELENENYALRSLINKQGV
jgi:hypothetical protein